MRAIDINQIVIVRDVEPTFRGHLPCRGLRGAAVYWSLGGGALFKCANAKKVTFLINQGRGQTWPFHFHEPTTPQWVQNVF